MSTVQIHCRWQLFQSARETFLCSHLFLSSLPNALKDQKRKPTTKVVVIGGGMKEVKKTTLREINNFAELKLDPRASLPSSFTICVSVLATTENLNPILFSLLRNDEKQWFAAVIHQLGDFVGKKFFYAGANQFVNLDTLPVFPNEWARTCLAFNTVSGLVQCTALQWVARGELVDNSTFAEIKDQKYLTGKIILGAHYHPYVAKWLQISNKVTNVNIFSSSLSVEKMQGYTQEKECGRWGDFLSWDEMHWNLHGDTVVQEIDGKGPCLEDPLNLYQAGFDQMETCMHFCENLGSRVPPVSTLEQWERLHTFLAGKLSSGAVWLPIDDRAKEGEWRDYYTHQLLNFSFPWFKSEPNGGTSENCAFMDFSHSLQWTDVSCWGSYACVCEKYPVKNSHALHGLRLRGLCPSSAIGIYYQPINDFADFAQLTITGVPQSTIQYDKNSRKWKLKMQFQNVTGVSRAAQHTFTLGKHNWTIRGDLACTNGNDDQYTTELKMTGCKSDSFTCDDGQCVKMEQRCNQLPDCRDHSDENGCNIIVLEKGYNRNVPPVSVENGKKEMVNVSLSIDLLKLVDINEEDYSIEIQFEITLKWIENRLVYQHLKTDRSLNALTQEDIQQLWLPEVIYENTDQKESTRLGVQWEWKTRMIVERNGKETPTDMHTVDETEIFQGKANPLIMFQTYTHKFQCIYDLKKYPFDTQICSIDMAMGSLDRASVRLIPEQMHMNQSLDMPIFRIVSWQLKSLTKSNSRMTTNMIIVLKRKVTSELMTTYFPTLLLTAITFATTFFKPFFFEAGLSVNLTTMLVMTTIFISKMESLPPTSDIKMIDIWLILCQIYPFLQVVLLTIMEYYREEEKDQRSNTLFVEPSSAVHGKVAKSEQSKAGNLLDLVSKWRASILKTLGKLKTCPLCMPQKLFCTIVL